LLFYHLFGKKSSKNYKWKNLPFTANYLSLLLIQEKVS